MEEKEKSTLIDKELEIENMQEFLLENKGIKLENLPTYEDLIKPESITETKMDNMQEVNTLPFFEPKIKKNEEVKENPVHRKRFKIAVGCFAIIGVLFAALACINGVSLALLTQKSKDNKKEITTLTQEVAELEHEYELQNASNPDADKVGFKLALPRNYPDNTADLTWFDKLSIFLMRLFG